jgi:hypothetical protein
MRNLSCTDIRSNEPEEIRRARGLSPKTPGKKPALEKSFDYLPDINSSSFKLVKREKKGMQDPIGTFQRIDRKKVSQYYVKKPDIERQTWRDYDKVPPILDAAFGSDFERFAAGGKYIPAKTRQALHENKNVVASKIIDGVSWFYNTYPKIQDGFLMVNGCKIFGFIPMLLNAIVLENIDKFGVGSNAGFVRTPDGNAKVVSIDSDGSFDFKDMWGLRKIAKSNVPFSTHPPQGNPSKDLLEVTKKPDNSDGFALKYDDIQKNLPLREELAQHVTDLSKITKDELKFIFVGGENRKVPDEINGYKTADFRCGIVDIVHDRIQKLSAKYQDDVSWLERIKSERLGLVNLQIA